MTKIKLDEISLVDFPAHTVNGFAVIKSASTEESSSIMDALGNRNPSMPELDLAKALAEASAADITKALAARADVTDIAKSITPVEPTEEDILKALPESVRKSIAARDEKIAEFEKAAAASAAEVAIAKAAVLDGEAVTKSKEDFTNVAFDHDVVAPAIRKFAETSPEAAEAIVTMMKAVNAQADGMLFDELGTSITKATNSDDPVAPLQTIAKALVADGKADNEADGFAKAVADPANKSLVDAYFAGGK